MIVHRRRRNILTALGLYTFAALFIGYFGVNAFTGAHGLRAQADLDKQLASMEGELGHLKAERTLWERRGGLLGPGRPPPRHAGRARPRARRLCRSARRDPADRPALAGPVPPGRVIHRRAFLFAVKTLGVEIAQR